MLKEPKKFIDEVKAFDGNNIDEWKLDALRPMLAEDWFNFEVMKNKSLAAGFLCSWIVNIVNYNTIYKKVKPLKDMAEAAQNTADEKTAALLIVKERVAVINEKVAQLNRDLQAAEDKKKAVEDEAQALQD